jgi:hypothetical protein
VKLRIIYIALLCFISLQGCATILHGGQQNLPIETTPPGVLATIGSQQCVTPCTLVVSRKERYIQFEQGQNKKKLPLSKEWNSGSVFFGNLWFPPGIIIDFLSGGAYEIQPIHIWMDHDADIQKK